MFIIVWWAAESGNVERGKRPVFSSSSGSQQTRAINHTRNAPIEALLSHELKRAVHVQADWQRLLMLHSNNNIVGSRFDNARIIPVHLLKALRIHYL